jgi:hypothetical protein
MSAFGNRVNTSKAPTFSVSQGFLGFGKISVGAHQSISIVTGVADIGLGRNGQAKLVFDHKNETNGCIDLSSDRRPKGTSLAFTLLDPRVNVLRHRHEGSAKGTKVNIVT